jgi:uncharacterized protein (DUF1330 family)
MPEHGLRVFTRKDSDMGAYVIVEATARDQEALLRYGSQVGPVIAEFGGEIVAFGPWQMLFGEPAFTNGMIIRFASEETAKAWYESPAYQSLLDIRDIALDCRFRLVGQKPSPVRGTAAVTHKSGG